MKLFALPQGDAGLPDGAISAPELTAPGLLGEIDAFTIVTYLGLCALSDLQGIHGHMSARDLQGYLLDPQHASGEQAVALEQLAARGYVQATYVM